MNQKRQRYCELNGDPVHMSYIDIVKCLPEYKVAGLATMFNLCVTASNASAEGMLISVAGSAAGLAVSVKAADFYEWIFHRLQYGKNFRDLTVDKEPDQTTPPTKPEHLKAANNVRDSFFILSLILGNKWILISLLAGCAAMGVINSDSKNNNQNFQLGMGFLGASTAFLSTRFGRAAIRHHNIYKKKWGLIDVPPPKEKDIPGEITQKMAMNPNPSMSA